MEPIFADTQIAQSAITTLLQFIGEDPARDGLLDTPARVVKAWRELTAGYRQIPEEILGRVFDVDCDELVMLRNVAFFSMCEHHMLPFYGKATVGYFPGKVVGISKLARLVECFARRLQVQERMTHQIADAVMTHLDAVGVGVVIKAHHLCMGCRGVRQTGTDMLTSVMRGRLRDDDKARNEFMQALNA